jgi:hypothetical protein
LDEPPRGSVQGFFVTAVEETSLEAELGANMANKYGPAVRIQYGKSKADCWYIKFDSEEKEGNDRVAKMWLRKLKRFALHVVSEELAEASRAGIHITQTRTGQMKDTRVPQMNLGSYYIHEKPVEE